MSSITIRPIKPTDYTTLQDIEVSANQLFLTANMSAIATDSPPPFTDFSSFPGWVAISSPSTDIPVAYICAELFYSPPISSLDAKEANKIAYIRQVTVLPSYGRRGLGKTLVEFVEGWAREQGCREVQLTTFRDVVWNRPWYEKLGYSVVGEEVFKGKEFQGLKAKLEEERRHILLKLWPRVGMRKVLYT